MNTQNIIKSIVACFMMCLLSFGATAQSTGEKLECEYVEWNVKSDSPNFERASNKDCILVQLVGFTREQCLQMETLSGSLSSNHVKMRMSEDLTELSISMNVKPVNAQKRMNTYNDCIASLKKHLK